jgi:hypothetical protein
MRSAIDAQNLIMPTITDPSAPASIADVSQGASSNVNLVAEQFELSKVSEDVASRSVSTSAIGPSVLDNFTSVGTPGDLALLPPLVEVTYQAGCGNKLSTVAPGRQSTRDRIVEIFGGRRTTSALVSRNMRSEEVPKRKELSSRSPTMNGIQPSSHMSQTFPVASDRTSESVWDTFTSSESLQTRRLVARLMHHSSNSGIHWDPAKCSAQYPELWESGEDMFGIQGRPTDHHSVPVEPAEQSNPSVATGFTRQRVVETHRSKVVSRPLARKMSFRKYPVRPGGIVPAKPATPCVFPGMPVDLHDDMSAYWEWLKEHGYVDRNYNFIPFQQPVWSMRLAQSEVTAPIEPIEILPAPAHELNGVAVVAKDQFPPQIVVRGFETSHSLTHPVKPNLKAKVGTDKFFVVPLEYSREHESAVQNHAACTAPPPRSTFGWLDGADDSDSDGGLLSTSAAQSRSHIVLSRSDGAGKEEDQDTAPRVSQALTTSLRRAASVHRQGRNVSFVETPQVLGGGTALGGSARASQPRSATASDIVAPTGPDRCRTPTLGLSVSIKRPSLGTIHDEDQSDAIGALSLGGTGTSTGFLSQQSSEAGQFVHAVIIQFGHGAAEAIALQKASGYHKTWAKPIDALAKLHHDEELERAQRVRDENEPIQHQRATLTDAYPPQDSAVIMEKSSRDKLLRNRSDSSLSQIPVYESIHVDSRAIYLTPQDEVPKYPQPGSVDYWTFLAQRPMFIFDKDGYIMRGHLVSTMITLYEGVFTAPDWASEIPNIKAQRAAKPTIKGILGGLVKAKVSEVDLSTDRHVLYWETLIVKADIRRGCELAKMAARHLAKQTQADIDNYLMAKDSKYKALGLQ